MLETTMKTIQKTVLAVALASIALSASAHRPWIMPLNTFIEAKEPVATIDGAISDQLFEFDTNMLKMDGALVTDPDGATSVIPAPLVGRFRSSVDLKLPKEGTYKISMVSLNTMGSYKLNGEMKRFRGADEPPAGATDIVRSTSHSRLETFVTANKPSMGAFKPSGEGLEMIPLTNPTELRTGETTRMRFTLDGKPLANQPFSLVPGGVKFRGVLGEVRLVTDAKGEASIKLPAPGQYWLGVSYPNDQRKGPPENGAKRYSYTATLAVLPE
jgi:uncharacterized GH25 family protein